MTTCIYSKKEFSISDQEHVLQNFLGARWVSSKIACNEVQALFGKTIDSALEKGLREFRNILGVKAGRGGDGPSLKNVEGSQGNKYHLLPGGVPYLAQPVITANDRNDGVREIFTKIGDMNQLNWALAELRNRYPVANWDAAQIKQQLKSEKQYLTENIHLGTGIGGDEYFRGLLKAAFNLLGVNAPEVALQSCFDVLRSYILNGEGDATNHIRWLATSDELAISKLGSFDHFVGLYSQGLYVDGIVQFFGGISHIVRLTDAYTGPEFRFAYQVEPLRNSKPAEIRNLDFDPQQLPQFADGYREPGPAVLPVYSAVFERLLKTHSANAVQKEISRIVDEALAPHQGKILTDQILDGLLEQLMKFIATRIRRN